MTATATAATAERLPTTGVWSRVGARIYDPFLAPGERAVMRRLRARLLREARGRVVEIGAGTGLNLPHYPAGLDELLVTEPDPAMLRRLERRLRKEGTNARALAAGADRLPLPDASVDTVVSTLVLCTVDEPRAALAEVARVLRPDGRLLFLEHVRAESPRLARWQDRLETPWRLFADGCRCNRPTLELLRDAGFETVALERATWRLMPRIVHPVVLGAARPPR